MCSLQEAEAREARLTEGSRRRQEHANARKAKEVECVLLQSNVFFYYRICSYYRMCSLTVECLLFL